MPAIPNIFRTRIGRLLGFFVLYMGKGLPRGYTGTAVALEFKRMGMSGAAIGTRIMTGFALFSGILLAHNIFTARMWRSTRSPAPSSPKTNEESPMA